MVAIDREVDFEELSLDQEVTNKLEEKNSYPSPQFEDAWFRNFSALFNPVATAVDLDLTTSLVNTEFKSQGRRVFNTDAEIPVYAKGPLAADLWLDATGATVNTPIPPP